MAMLFQHAGQFVHFSRRIVDDQNACHGFPHYIVRRLPL